MMTECLEVRWAEALTMFPNTKRKIVPILEQTGQLRSGVAKTSSRKDRRLDRRRRDELFSEDAYLLRIEHSHYVVSSFDRTPDPELAAHLLSDIKERQLWQLSGTPGEQFAERTEIKVSSHLREALRRARSSIGCRSDIGYLVGIEPVSMKSLICGYKQPGLCLFAGVAQGSSSALEAAEQELREEGCLDLGVVFSQRYQKLIRERMNLQDLPFRYLKEEAFYI